MVKRQLLALLALLMAGFASADPLSLLVRGHPVSEPVFSLFAAPGEHVRIGVTGTAGNELEFLSSTGVSGFSCSCSKSVALVFFLDPLV